MRQPIPINLPIGRKRGRPSNALRAQTKRLFPEWSARTFARWWRAYQILVILGDEQRWQAAVQRATRPNGSFNVSQLGKDAEHYLRELRREELR
jgi:hypothetical protein